MATPERVNEVKEAIICHLNSVGPKDWEEIQKDFPDIPNSSFWRYAKAARAQLKNDAVLTDNADLFTQPPAEEPAEQHPWEQQHLNATFRGLKQAQRFQELYADGLALREDSLHGGGRIKNPAQFAKSIRIREQLLYAELKVMNTINFTDASTAFWDKVLEAVLNASPEAAIAVQISLHELKESWETKKKGGGVSGYGT